MKNALVIVLFLCLLTQCIARLGVIGLFELRKDYIASVLCENRDKPAMKCCGKCYLRKQLKKVDDRENPGKQTGGSEKSEAFVCVLPALIQSPGRLMPCAVEAAVQHPVVHNLYDTGFPSSVFHPPAVLA